MRPLMETLCFVLAAMTTGLHEAVPGLHPSTAWENVLHAFEKPTRWVTKETTVKHGISGNKDRQKVVPNNQAGEETRVEGGNDETVAVSWKEHSEHGRETDGDVRGRIVVGVVMERYSNHSPHRLLQPVLEGMDRSRFRLVVFAHATVTHDYPAAGQAILQDADEVVTMPWHPFVEGLPDTFGERKVIAEAKASISPLWLETRETYRWPRAIDR